jgi:hypothetical protein
MRRRFDCSLCKGGSTCEHAHIKRRCKQCKEKKQATEKLCVHNSDVRMCIACITERIAGEK